MNEYELSYVVEGSGAGVVKERIQAGSEYNARNLVRAKYGAQQVRIYGGRMTRFGDRQDNPQDKNR